MKTLEEIKEALTLCAGDDCSKCCFYKYKMTCQQDLVKAALEYIKKLEGDKAHENA